MILCYQYDKRPDRISPRGRLAEEENLERKHESARQAEDPPEPDPGERESALGAALLRIGASLDFDT